MQYLEVSGAVRLIYMSLGVKGLIHQQMHVYSFNDLKFTLKYLKRSYMFRSYDIPQGAHIVLC